MRNLETRVLRDQLIDRQQKLKALQSRGSIAPQYIRLLQEVDAAIERFDTGSFGICETCNEPVERERLLADPLVRFCLDHLSDEQRAALERDLELASRIQAGLLPANDMVIDGWNVSYHYQPAGIVSGDYCDVVSKANSDGVVFALGDISGKGVAASLLMSHVHATFRSLSTAGLPLNTLMEQANRVLCESTLPTQFATLVCGRMSGSGDMEICNAGHCPPLLMRGGDAVLVEGNELPLGLFQNVRYSTNRLALRRGDTLLLYTDGVTESWNTDGDEYGVDRLKAVMQGSGGLEPRQLIAACAADVMTFSGKGPQRDDLTIMTIRRLS